MKKKILALLIILAFMVPTNLLFASVLSSPTLENTSIAVNETISSPARLNWQQEKNIFPKNRNETRPMTHLSQNQVPMVSAKPSGGIINFEPEPSTRIFEITQLQSCYMTAEGAHITSSVTWLQTQVPYWQQDMSNWCWAATLVMQHQWWSPTQLGSSYQQQSEIVQYIKGSIVDQPATVDEVYRVIREWNLIDPTYFSFQITYKGPGKLFSQDPPTGYADDPKTWINIGSPVIACIDTDNPMDGVFNHYVLIVGFDDGLNGGSVIIHDPWFSNWWPGHSGQPCYEFALTYSEFNSRWNSWYEGPVWDKKYRGLIAGIPGDQEYVHSMVALNGLPSEVDLGQTYELQLALTEDGSDAGSSRYFWAQGVFLRLFGAELVSASSGGFKSYQAYDEFGNSVPIAGAKIIEFYSDFTLRSATIYAYATIKVTSNVIAKYRGWITDEDDMTHCSVHTQSIDDDRPNLLTMNNAELVIDRKPNDVQNDRSNFLDYPAFEKQASLKGLASSAISVSVNPSQINLGGGTTISGTISSSTPGDFSGTVFVQYSTNNVNWYDIGTTTSSSSGSYSYWWTPSSTGTFYVRSYWNGNANYAGATSSSVTLTVVSGAGNLGDHTMCKNVQSSSPWDPIGRTNTFYTDDPYAYSWLHFNGPIYGSHSVHWDWYAPDGTHWPADYTIPDARDYGYEYWDWYRTWCSLGPLHFPDSELGKSFTVQVYYDGNWVVTESWTVIKHQSSISVSISTTVITYGQSVTVSSQISPSFSDGTTTLQYSIDGSNWNGIASGTPSNGYYAVSWTPPNSGTYYLRAIWSGDLNYYGSTSSTQTLTVSRASTTLTTSLSSTTITYGSSVTITASISPQLQGKLVEIQYSLDDITWYFLSSGTTNSIGQYAYIWTPAIGTYYLRSLWAGDNNYYGATSSSQMLTVSGPPLSISFIQPTNRANLTSSPVLLQVNVTANGLPVSGVTVTFYADGSSPSGVATQIGSATTNLNGNASIAWMPPYAAYWQWYVTADKPGYTSVTSASQSLWYIPSTNNLYVLPASSKSPENSLLGQNTVLLSSSSQTILASPGSQIAITIEYRIYAPTNPNEIDQLFFIASWTPTWPPPSGYYYPIYNGIPGTSPVTGSKTFDVTVPSTAGTYYLWFCSCAHYSMEQAVNTYTKTLITPAHIKIVTGQSDIATTNVTISKSVVGQGYSLNINVTAANQGDYTETFNVTVYANTTSIATQTVILTSSNSTTIIFTWNTSGFAKGNYTISAYAWPVPGETDTADNRFTGGVVTVTITGDLDGDSEVGLEDLVILARAYGSKLGEPGWNPNADINDDGEVTLVDLVILAKHYGE